MKIIKNLTTLIRFISLIIAIACVIISTYKEQWVMVSLSCILLLYIIHDDKKEEIKDIIDDYVDNSDGLDITIEKTSTGYSAYFDDLPVFTTGKDVPETLKNLCEAYELWESHIDDSYKMTENHEENVVKGQNS